MANNIRLEFKYESDINIKRGGIVKDNFTYCVYLCCDGISTWIGSGHTLKEAIDDINNGGDERCLKEKMLVTLSEDEMKCFDRAFNDNYIVNVAGGYSFDIRKIVTIDNIMNGTPQK